MHTGCDAVVCFVVTMIPDNRIGAAGAAALAPALVRATTLVPAVARIRAGAPTLAAALVLVTVLAVALMLPMAPILSLQMPSKQSGPEGLKRHA